MTAATEPAGVVVGVDGSGRDAAALDVALREAAPARWPVRAVRLQRTRGSDPPQWAPGERAAVEQAVRAAQERQAGLCGDAAQVSVELLAGSPAAGLVEAGAQAALLVVGDRARGPVEGALLGSTTRQVVHASTTPVMVVPAPARPPGPVSRVVVGVDGSRSSHEALGWASASARRHGCALLLLHAWLITSLPERQATGYVPSLAEFDALASAWLDEQVAASTETLQGVDVQTYTVHGSAPEALMRASGPDDLVVVGARGQGGFASLVLGSVADQLVRYCESPVVVVRGRRG